jgi:hypothetical protein
MRPLIQINDEVREMNDDEFASYEAQQAEAIANAPIIKGNEVRAERNRLLAESDWTQLADVVLTEDAKLEWTAYRQELRDITLQAGFPFNVTYPTKP